MTHAVLTQWLIDVTRGPLKEKFRADREATIAGSGLDSALQEALRKQDMATLWLAGPHPMALMYFSRLCGWDNARYYSCLEQAESKKLTR